PPRTEAKGAGALVRLAPAAQARSVRRRPLRSVYPLASVRIRAQEMVAEAAGAARAARAASRAGRARARPTPWRARGVDELKRDEHTSELQSRGHLVCRLLLEK